MARIAFLALTYATLSLLVLTPFNAANAALAPSSAPEEYAAGLAVTGLAAGAAPAAAAFPICPRTGARPVKPTVPPIRCLSAAQYTCCSSCEDFVISLQQVGHIFASAERGERDGAAAGCSAGLVPQLADSTLTPSCLSPISSSPGRFPQNAVNATALLLAVAPSLNAVNATALLLAVAPSLVLQLADSTLGSDYQSCDVTGPYTEGQFILEQFICGITCNPDSGLYFALLPKPTVSVCKNVSQQFYGAVKDVTFPGFPGTLGSFVNSPDTFTRQLFQGFATAVGIKDLQVNFVDPLLKACWNMTGRPLPAAAGCCDPFILPATCPRNLLDTTAHPEYLKVLNRTVPDFCSNQTNAAAPPSASSPPAPGESPAGSSPPAPEESPANSSPPAPEESPANSSPPAPEESPAASSPPAPGSPASGTASGNPSAAGTGNSSPPPPPGKAAGSAGFFGPGSMLTVLVAGVLALLV
ncbi:unnamed protein product [Closterium sp. NIES-65]|nr:unnamed protein product [Closterium sp. NIES-65]